MAVAHVALACQLGGHDFLLCLSDSVWNGVRCIERRIILNHAISSLFLGRDNNKALKLIEKRRSELAVLSPNRWSGLSTSNATICPIPLQNMMVLLPSSISL